MVWADLSIIQFISLRTFIAKLNTNSNNPGSLWLDSRVCFLDYRLIGKLSD
jgi:hypothetical protein